jgi:hypothetical protein
MHKVREHVTVVVVQVGAMKIYAAAVQALRKKERQDETQFGGKPKFGSQLFRFVKFHPSYAFDALLWCYWPFSPPNCLTLPITLNICVGQWPSARWEPEEPQELGQDALLSVNYLAYVWFREASSILGSPFSSLGAITGTQCWLPSIWAA